MKGSQPLKDDNRERSIFAVRTIIAIFIVMGMLGALVWRLYHLQVVDYEHYNTLSDKNRMQLQPVAPNRGLIYDRHGALLADNQPVFSLSIIPELVDNLESQLSALRGLVDISDDQVKRFRKLLKRARRPYQPVSLKGKLSEAEIAIIEVRRHEFQGVEVIAQLARYYPFGELTAHSLGYVGRINEEELATLDERNYSATNYIGKLGVERFYEAELHGTAGLQTIETNAGNRILRVLNDVPPVPGKNLVLHLDIALQAKAQQLLEGKRAAVVAIEPSTGGILAMVSTPSFDPNKFVTGIDHASYDALRDSLDLPLFNRALKGRYPPGSTIKPIVGMAGLDVGAVTKSYSIMDYGFYRLPNEERLYRDWKREGHGRMNLFTSITESCDTYFYDLAFKMGVDDMSRYLGYFGFGQNTSLDIDEARSGLLPSRDWKRGLRGEPWYPGDSLNMGIGQGYMLSTPLQLAAATALIANRGAWVAPRMLKQTGDKSIVLSQRENALGDVSLRKPENWEYIVDAMESVMHGKKGTARGSGYGAQYRMAGKTGTAQVVGIAQGEEYDAEALAERHRDHALFVGFAPVDEPLIAVAVIVENGGGGSVSAAPVARALFDHWLVDAERLNVGEASGE